MGMLGEYSMVDTITLEHMMKLNYDDLVEEVEALQERNIERYSIDKLWDGLHFLLCGISASEPIEGNKLSEAVIGVHVFNEEDEDADFIAYTKNTELAEIILALKNINIVELEQSFHPSSFRKNKIYPNIWVDTDKEVLLKELIGELRGVLDFYEKALKNNENVILSIY